VSAIPLRRVAASDYKTPCPYCGLPPARGDSLVRVKGRAWWHEACHLRWRNERSKRAFTA